MKKAKKQRLLAFSTLLLTGALALGVAAMPATAEAAETYAGTLTVTDTGAAFTGSHYHSAYNKTWVDVKDTEDLIIEYDLISSPDNLYIFGITKGMQGEAEALNYDAYLETVLINSSKQMSLGSFGGYVVDSYRAKSTRSEAVKEYVQANNVKYYTSDASYNVRFITKQFGASLGSGRAENKGMATENLRYKHIYHADGSYELRIQHLSGTAWFAYNNVIEEGWQTVLQSGPTFNSTINAAGGYTIPEALKTNDEKIFVNRSGYIGFTGAFPNGTANPTLALEIDNFKVSVTDGTNTTVKINETYDCTKDSVYNTDNWGYTDGGSTKLNCNMPSDEIADNKYAQGTITLSETGTRWTMNAKGVYNDTFVTVADNEDLVIEYDFLKNGEALYFGLLKGLPDNNGEAARSAETMAEALVLLQASDQVMMGMYTGLNSLTADEVTASDYSSELKTYLNADTGNRNHGYAGQVPYTYGLDMSYGENNAANPKEFGTPGYTYKHVFLAAGGYECYAKAIGAEDSEYSLILKTANTWAEDSFHGTNGAPADKIFKHRSGYVGFAFLGESATLNIEIDNFKVKTVGSSTTTVINETYTRATLNSKVSHGWKVIGGNGATTINYEDIAPATADGAGIRVEVGNMTRSGIRFQTNVDKDLVAFLEASKEAGEISTIEYGTLITAKDLLGENEFTAEALTAASVAYKNLTASGFNADCATDTTYGYYASLVGIQAENYYRSWIARGYVKTTDSTGATTYYYSDFDVASAGTSVYEAAVAIYENTEYYNTLSTDAQAVVKSYIDGVVVVTLDEVNGTATYAGEVAGYTAPYTLSVDTTTGVLTVTSTAYIRTLVVNGVQVKAEVADGAKTATYTFRQSA